MTGQRILAYPTIKILKLFALAHQIVKWQNNWMCIAVGRSNSVASYGNWTCNMAIFASRSCQEIVIKCYSTPILNGLVLFSAIWLNCAKQNGCCLLNSLWQGRDFPDIVTEFCFHDKNCNVANIFRTLHAVKILHFDRK